jgi:hypothetical protein
MGVVYRAKDTVLRRGVAVKLAAMPNVGRNTSQVVVADRRQTLPNWGLLMIAKDTLKTGYAVNSAVFERSP